MLVLALAAWALSWVACANAADLPTRQSTNDPCYQIYEGYPQQVDPDTNHFIDAELADRCLRSLTLDKSAGKDQLREVRTYLQLYSAQDIWKNPPKSQLSLKPVDLNATLDDISSAIDGGDYKTVYDLDLALKDALLALHDGHTVYQTACSDLFIFTHAYPLVSVADDTSGKPSIYLGEQTKDGIRVGDKVTKINDEDVVDYLTKLAVGGADSAYNDVDARFNDLFLRPVIPEAILRVEGGLGNFARRDRLDKSPLSITFENGTSVDVEWRAELDYLLFSRDGKPIGRLDLPFRDNIRELCENGRYFSGNGKTSTGTEPGEDPSSIPLLSPPVSGIPPGITSFPTGTVNFDSFLSNVLSEPSGAAEVNGNPRNMPREPQGLPNVPFETESFGPLQTSDGPEILSSGLPLGSSTASPTAATLPSGFPTPIAKFPSNQLTLYTLGKDVGVIGIHSFVDDPSEGLVSLLLFDRQFSTFLQRAIAYLKNNGFSKVIIDVMNNGGGKIEVGYGALSLFFPGAPPFYGQDFRSSPALEYLAKQVNSPGGLSSLSEDYPTLDLRLLNKVSGANYSSTEEFLGPQRRNGGYFTSLSRGDAASLEHLLAAPLPPWSNDPFKAEDITVVSNSLCASACAVFVQAMEERGVRTVAFGGRPDSKQIQAVGGVKGAQEDSYPQWNLVGGREGYSRDYLAKPPPYTLVMRVNLKNAYKKDSDIPLEFIYSPATYKLSFTKNMFTDLRNIWVAAANTVWNMKLDLKSIREPTASPLTTPTGASTWSGQGPPVTATDNTYTGGPTGGSNGGSGSAGQTSKSKGAAAAVRIPNADSSVGLGFVFFVLGIFGL